MAVITVVCTGRGSHKRLIFNQFTVDGDQLTMQPFRIANMPDLAAAEVEGVAMETKAVMPPSYDPRTSHGWRWKCPRCGTDRRFSDATLILWLRKRRVSDISQHA